MANLTLTNGVLVAQYSGNYGYDTGFNQYGSLSPDNVGGSTIYKLDVTITGALSLHIQGTHAKTDLTNLSINGTTFTGAGAATHSTGNENIFYGADTYTQWGWTNAGNPFGVTAGTSVPIVLDGIGAPAIVNPDTNITTSWPAGSISSTSFSVTLSNASSATLYEVRTGSYTGTVVGSRYGNGTLSVSNTSHAAGTAVTYYLTGRVPVANGGNNTSSAITSQVINRSSSGGSDPVGGGSADYGVQVFNSSGVLTMDVSDTLSFISGTGTLTVANNTSSSTNVAVAGARVGDIVVAETSKGAQHALKCTVTSSNTVNVVYTLADYPASGTSTYPILVINLGT